MRRYTGIEVVNAIAEFSNGVVQLSEVDIERVILGIVIAMDLLTACTGANSSIDAADEFASESFDVERRARHICSQPKKSSSFIV